MDLEIVSRLPVDVWSEFVERHPHGNIFQTPVMFRLFQDTRNYSPVLAAVVDSNKEIAGILLGVVQREWRNPFGYLTSRCLVWGGPLVKPFEPRFENRTVDMLLRELVRRVKSRAIYIQIRNLFDMQRYLSIFNTNGFEYADHLDFVVKTANRDQVRQTMSASRWRQIKKGMKAGAEIVEPVDIDQVKRFYYILKDLYRSTVRKPLPDWSFFENFFYQNRKEGWGKYFLVRYQERIIGGIMCPITRRRGIYEWYVCGLDRQFKGVYPSVLATWAAIDYALNNGLDYFDFMGAGRPDQDYGVREFKSKFGGELVHWGRIERINNRFFYRMGKLGLKWRGKLKS